MSHLLIERRFGPFYITQFLGAFNDNFYKTAMLLAIVYKLSPDDPKTAAVMSQLAAALFILPFFLFSYWAGVLADRHDKAQMIRIIKGAEIFIMLMGAAGLVAGHSLLLFVALFAMGVHSAFFGPIKYAIIPQHVRACELTSATALVGAGTFLAILFGQLAAGLLATHAVMMGVVAVAIMGWAAAWFIPPAPPLAPLEQTDKEQAWQRVQGFLVQRQLRQPILQISLFWALGLVMTTQLPPLVKQWMGASSQLVSAYLALFSIGIALGALLAMQLQKLVRPKRQVDIAANLIALMLVLVYYLLSSVHPVGVAAHSPPATDLLRLYFGAVLLVLAMAAGLYVVPLYVALQNRPRPHERAQLLSVNNICNAAFMVTASLGAALSQTLGLGGAALWLMVGSLWIVFHYFFR